MTTPILQRKHDLTIIFLVIFYKKALFYKKLTVIMRINRQFYAKKESSKLFLLTNLALNTLTCAIKPIAEYS